MPIPVLSIEDETSGLPRQLVPLRLACLIADWSPKLLLAMLARSCPDELPGIEGLEVTPGRIGRHHSSFYKKLLDSLPSDNELRPQLAALPANHCILSDELAHAFTAFIDSTWDRQEAVEAGAGLRWTPALLGLDDLFSECPDLPPPVVSQTRPNGRQQQRQDTLGRYGAWWEEFLRLKAANPSMSPSRAAKKIPGAGKKSCELPNGEMPSPETIRTVLSKIQTKVSAGIPLTTALQQVAESR